MEDIVIGQIELVAQVAVDSVGTMFQRWSYTGSNPGIPYCRCDVCHAPLVKGWFRGEGAYNDLSKNHAFFCEKHIKIVNSLTGN